MSKKFIYTAVCFLLIPCLLSQGQTVLINSNDKTSQKLDSLANYAQSVFIKGEILKAEQLVDEGLADRTIDQYVSAKVNLLTLKSKIVMINGDIHQAIFIAKNALENIGVDSSKMKGIILSNLSRYYQNNDQLDSMLLYFERSEEWHNQYNPYRKWILYEHTSLKYSELKMFDKAEALLLKAYQLTNEKGVRMDHGLVLYRLGVLYNKVDDIPNLVKYKKEYFDFLSAGGIAHDRLHSLLKFEKLEGSDHIDKLKRIKKECSEVEFENCVLFCNSSLARLYLEQSDFQSAIRYLNFNLESKYQESLIKRKQDLYLLIKSYKGLGDYKKVFELHEEYIAIQDSIYNLESKSIALEFEEKYQSAQKKKEIAVLESQNELKDIKLKSNSNFQGFLITSICLLASVISLIYFLLIQRKKYAKQLEEKNILVSKSLEDKEILLKEIHHRVKNNLQVVSSLLSLQSNYIKDSSALDAINEGRNRVSSMALIHQNLYQHENLTSIDVRHYLNELIENLFDSYNVNENEIVLHKEIDPIRLDIDTMIPLGLIINELVSNALKHAFKSNKQGELSISIKNISNNIHLTIKDNGVGMNEESFTNSASFGNKMINAFKQKLGAELSIINNNGTTIKMVITKFNLAA